MPYTEATLLQPWTRRPTTWHVGHEYPVGTEVIVGWQPGGQRATVYEPMRWGLRPLFSVALEDAKDYVKSVRSKCNGNG